MSRGIWARPWIRCARAEYRRLAGRGRRYIKGQKYTLLSRKENLTLDGKKALKTLLSANKRLNYRLCPQGRVSANCGATSARAGRDASSTNWRASLKWQRLKPYEKFAAMIDRHWHGIAAYCRLENKISLGFVEGLNNKIAGDPAPRLRLAQRRISAAQFSPACCRRCSGADADFSQNFARQPDNGSHKALPCHQRCEPTM